MTTFDRHYLDLIRRVYYQGDFVHSARTGYGTKALAGQTLELYPSGGFPLLTVRKIPVEMFVAEVVWMITGKKDLAFLRQFTKIWDDFAEPDGTVASAYGYRWRTQFGRDQLMELIEHLKEEPSSRQGVVIMWDPSSDGLRSAKKKNVPCPYTFTVNIIANKLNLHLTIRSNDLMLGNPTDVAGYALLQAILAQHLGVGVGKLTVSISHAHVYENHFDQLEELLKREDQNHAEIVCTLPPNSFERALQEDASLVREIAQMFASQYAPQKSVKRMQIAL